MRPARRPTARRGASRDAAARSITLKEQRKVLEREWPGCRAKLRRGLLTVHGVVQPSPLSAPYDVRIVYGVGRPPEVYIESPRLHDRGDGQAIPHVYSSPDGPRPCLWLPSTGEWSNRKLLAQTVVPWTALWLHYYELWLATGEWRGGGAPHPRAAGATDAGTKPDAPVVDDEHAVMDSSS